MSETAISNTEQTWPGWKKKAQYGLLVAGFLATFVLPIFLLIWASDALDDNRALADQYSTWSYGLVVLAPSFFVTSFLAMGSSLSRGARLVVGFIAVVLAVVIYGQLASIGESFLIPALLGIAGVLYCWAADIFAPNGAQAERNPA